MQAFVYAESMLYTIPSGSIRATKSCPLPEGGKLLTTPIMFPLWEEILPSENFAGQIVLHWGKPHYEGIMCPATG